MSMSIFPTLDTVQAAPVAVEPIHTRVVIFHSPMLAIDAFHATGPEVRLQAVTGRGTSQEHATNEQCVDKYIAD
jgi:hypothetical protein